MSAEAPIASLDVYLGTALVGSVYDTQPLSFEYAQSWLPNPGRIQLANIPLRAGRIDNEFVLAYFDNLLPEGALREHISRQLHATSTFALLRAVAGDTAGSMVLLPSGQKPEPSGYELTSWAKLGHILRGDEGITAFDIKGRGARISLSGAQDKALIYIDSTGAPALPLGTSPSSHILKPSIRALPGIWESAANETIVMRAAAKCRLTSAEVFFEPNTAACVVKRFDRFVDEHGELARLIQYDLCQLNGTPSDRKYEAEGGPGIRRCAELIRRYSVMPAVDLRSFLAWVFFNLYVGNNDGHAKNLSLLAHRQGGARLAPFYDLMCTRIYPGLSRNYAFKIGGEDKPGQITREHVVEMANELGLRPRFVMQIADSLSRSIVPALKEAIDEISPVLPVSAQTFARKLLQEVNGITKKFQRRLFASPL